MALPNLSIEKSLWKKGINHIVGIDEVGRGAWAGPLVAAGVILSADFKIPKGFNESKQLSSIKRIQLDKYIREHSLSMHIAEISHSKINKIGITKSTQSAFTSIVKRIIPTPNYSLIDAFHIKNLSLKKQKAIIKGDTISASIAAASIIAKVYRDTLMENMAVKFPNYGFEKHKGYGTKFHQLTISKFGFTNIHRTSFNISYLIK